VLKKQNQAQKGAEADQSVTEAAAAYEVAGLKKDKSLNSYQATVFFEEGCEMENIRAFGITHNLREFAQEVYFQPEDIIDNDAAAEVIRREGFRVLVKTRRSYEEMDEFFRQTIFLRKLELLQLENDIVFSSCVKEKAGSNVSDSEYAGGAVTHAQSGKEAPDKELAAFSNQSIISVNVSKLDKLMDLVGEMVIAEAMVTQNPEIRRLELEGTSMVINFYRQNQFKKVLPIAVDYSFNIPVGNHNLVDSLELIRQVKDPQDGDIVEVVDFKTSDYKPDIFTTTHDLRLTIQVYAYRKLFNVKEQRILYHFLKGGKEIYSFRDDDEMRRLELTINGVATAIESGLFYPHYSFLCNACPLRMECNNHK
jgi:chemotaxis protein histidine kinase CheA